MFEYGTIEWAEMVLAESSGFFKPDAWYRALAVVMAERTPA